MKPIPEAHSAESLLGRPAPASVPARAAEAAHQAASAELAPKPMGPQPKGFHEVRPLVGTTQGGPTPVGPAALGTQPVKAWVGSQANWQPPSAIPIPGQSPAPTDPKRRGPKQPRLVAVVRALSAADAVWAGRILGKAGLVVEVAFTTPEAYLAIAELVADGFCVGAGTVLDAVTANNAIGAGADFLVAPGASPEAAMLAAEAGRLFIPGALTPTEVMARQAEGFAHLKLFPAAAMGGASYLKLLADPFPGLSLVPTGGVQLGEVKAYAEAGAAALAVGSSLAPTMLMAERHSDELWKRVDRWLQAGYEATWQGDAPPWLP